MPESRTQGKEARTSTNIGLEALRAVLNAAVAVAVVTTGYIYFVPDVDNRATYHTFYGTGAIMSYNECVTGSGGTSTRKGCTVTSSGASAGSTFCAIQNPYDGVDSVAQGSGVLLDFQLDVAANPADVTFDIGIVTSLTSSGVNMFDNADIGSGQFLRYTSSGALAGALSSGSYVKVTAGADPTSYARARCKAVFRQAHLE